jgi:hypothetical protein
MVMIIFLDIGKGGEREGRGRGEGGEREGSVIGP